ncbi:hypothetical protein ACGFII_20755 [Micromonospora chalcea]
MLRQGFGASVAGSLGSFRVFVGFFRVRLSARESGVTRREQMTVQDLVEKVALANPEPPRTPVGTGDNEVDTLGLVFVSPIPQHYAIQDNWDRMPPPVW